MTIKEALNIKDNLEKEAKERYCEDKDFDDILDMLTDEELDLYTIVCKTICSE
jgi:hypothetical protein